MRHEHFRLRFALQACRVRITDNADDLRREVAAVRVERNLLSNRVFIWPVAQSHRVIDDGDRHIFRVEPVQQTAADQRHTQGVKIVGRY